MKTLYFFILLVVGLSCTAQTLDALKIQPNEIPVGFVATEEEHCISIQACTFYESPEIYEGFMGKLKQKAIQNFVNGKDSGCIMYFEFEKKFTMQSFLQGLLWGGKKATTEHPEEIYINDKWLVIYSFPLKNELKEVSKAKVVAVLK
jgi:hypothetical protein